MTSRLPRHPTTVALIALALALVGTTARADTPALDGRWKLVVLTFGDDDFLILDLKPSDGGGQPGARVVSAQSFLGDVGAAEVAVKGDVLTLKVPLPQGDPVEFRGTFRGGKALGAVRFGRAPYPARLERTESQKVAAPVASPLRTQVGEALAEPDPKKRAARLRSVIAKHPTEPAVGVAYAALIDAAQDGGLTTAEVHNLIKTWLSTLESYGPDVVNETRWNALKRLTGKPAYAALTTDLALAAEKALGDDAPLERRGEVVGLVARSARLAGRQVAAAQAERRLKTINAKLDAEYESKVPPFKPEAFAGRANKKADRAVVVELFTGAECPPCVAADVAFDALRTTYAPTEVITLQYHLNIPGPDPLTNADTEARQPYYGDEADGTPSVFLDGKSVEDIGGGLSQAEENYQELRRRIDPRLETEKQAEIVLTTERAGHDLTISARANVAGKNPGKPRLRLVLVESQVHYAGGNRVRIHHNVVRAFPGGVDGKALEDGKAAITTTIDLAELRKRLNTDLGPLAVMAFVQDDADHSIWQGAQTAVKDVSPPNRTDSR